MTQIIQFMEIAIEEAKMSLREGNHGFGAVIIRNGKLVSQAHDCEESEGDPTSHAEINAIKLASGTIGKDLKGCILISTHEPCPMCASAIVWAGIEHIAYGYSIDRSIQEGRKRIGLTCRELFKRAHKTIRIDEEILPDKCSLLYRRDVRDEIKRLRNYTDKKLMQYNEISRTTRTTWFKENKDSFTFLNNDLLISAYNLLLTRFKIKQNSAPIVSRTANSLVFHSKNFCPTLEACRILGYDTRYICKKYNENSTDQLVKQVNKRLHFKRNYNKLRPYADYCEEMIELDNEV